MLLKFGEICIIHLKLLDIVKKSFGFRHIFVAFPEYINFTRKSQLQKSCSRKLQNLLLWTFSELFLNYSANYVVLASAMYRFVSSRFSTLVSRIDDLVRLIFSTIYSQPVCLIWVYMFNGFSNNCSFVCFLGTFSLQNDKNLSKKPVNNNFWSVCLIHSEKNSSLYPFQICMLINF